MGLVAFLASLSSIFITPVILLTMQIKVWAATSVSGYVVQEMTSEMRENLLERMRRCVELSVPGCPATQLPQTRQLDTPSAANALNAPSMPLA